MDSTSGLAAATCPSTPTGGTGTPPASFHRVKGEAGPINEMPFFTFLFADLARTCHGAAVHAARPGAWHCASLWTRLVRSARRAASAIQALLRELPVLALAALTMGALWPMNTWDFPTYLGLMGVALVLRELNRRGRLDMAGLGPWLCAGSVIAVGALVLFLPFHQHYASAYFGAELWKGSRSPLWAYLLIHGFFLFVLVSYMLTELFSGPGHNALVRSLRLNLRYWRRRSAARAGFARTCCIPLPASGWPRTSVSSRCVLVLVDRRSSTRFGHCCRPWPARRVVVVEQARDPARQLILP